MATLNAEAYLQGDSEVQPAPFVISGGHSIVSGDSSVAVGPQVGRYMFSDLEGGSSLNVDWTFLWYSNLTGDASVTSEAALDIDASSSIVGGSSLGCAVNVDCTASASVEGDAQIAASSLATYKAGAAVVGDAQLTAKALPDDEIAIDLRGDSQIDASTFSDLQAASDLQGGSTLTVVPLVRLPIIYISEGPGAEVGERLVGYQPGRKPPEYRERFVILVR